MSMLRLRRLQRCLPAVIGGLILVVIGLLPVSLPTEDDISTLADVRGDGVYVTVAPTTTNTLPRPIGPVFTGVTVAQEFSATGTEITAVALVLATYQRANSGTIQVLMQTQTNGQWQTLGFQTVEKTTLRDNVLNTVRFNPPLKVKRGQIIRIVLQADGNEQSAISWWINPSYQRPGFALFQNGDPLAGTAQFQVSYARASGRFAGMIGPVWTRMTVFLDPLWRTVLAVGLLSLLGSFLVLGRYLPDKASVLTQQVSPIPPRERESGFSPFLARGRRRERRADRPNAERMIPDVPEGDG